MLIPLLATTGCNPEKESVISAPSVEITDGMMSPEVLEAFGRVSEAVPSPDGKKIAFTVGYESIESNASNAEIYIMNADGIEKVLYTLSEGWLFGEGIGKFSSETTIFSAAVEDTEIWRLSYQQNQQLLREQPEYTQLLLRCVTYKQIYLRYEVENLCFNSCKERLKRAICTEVDQSTLIDSAWYELNHQYSHYELSILISSARVTVSKLLSELCNDNFIRVLNRKIQVNAKQYDEYISNMKIL